MACASETSTSSIRLGPVEGYLGKQNDVIYHCPKSEIPIGFVVFFGGDMQDYKENMLAHRDNKRYSDWDLESTAVLLHNHFPDAGIVIMKPAKMSLKTFSCYENFVDVNNFGAPSYLTCSDSLKHLKLLLENLSTVKDSFELGLSAIGDKPVQLVGFSKGCVVLNQFLYSIHSLVDEPDPELEIFLKRVKKIYWVEGGHSGSSPTWIIDKPVIESFSKLNISVRIDVTPYQVQCESRPRIGKEEKVFRDTLARLGVNVMRRLHFTSQPRSLELHFEVLKHFH